MIIELVFSLHLQVETISYAVKLEDLAAWFPLTPKQTFLRPKKMSKFFGGIVVSNGIPKQF